MFHNVSVLRNNLSRTCSPYQRNMKRMGMICHYEHGRPKLWSSELMVLRNITYLNICHSNSERLTTFRLWDEVCRVQNNSSPTSAVRNSVSFFCLGLFEEKKQYKPYSESPFFITLYKAQEPPQVEGYRTSFYGCKSTDYKICRIDNSWPLERL